MHVLLFRYVKHLFQIIRWQKERYRIDSLWNVSYVCSMQRNELSSKFSSACVSKARNAFTIAFLNIIFESQFLTCNSRYRVKDVFMCARDFTKLMCFTQNWCSSLWVISSKYFVMRCSQHAFINFLEACRTNFTN